LRRKLDRGGGSAEQDEARPRWERLGGVRRAPVWWLDGHGTAPVNGGATNCEGVGRGEEYGARVGRERGELDRLLFIERREGEGGTSWRR
jgi:hypothetical protein